MTHLSSATDVYIHHADQPYGKRWATTVGRFQEGFLRDKVCNDLDDAFVKAVDAAIRLLPVIQLTDLVRAASQGQRRE